MVRCGKTAAGTQRWKCRACGATQTNKIDNAAKLLAMFLAWLFSKERQIDMAGGGRTFRRKTRPFWEIWPIAPQTGELYDVLFLDGIYLARNVVVLIAASEDHVVAWYIAQSENSRAWGALMARVPPPAMAVTDGGPGFEKARRRLWPNTRVQRCLFHVFCQVRRYTTSRPKLEAGRELLVLAKALLHIEKLKDAQGWADRVIKWCERWEDFLAEKTEGEDGKLRDTHERLVKARDSLMKLIRKEVLFTYLDPALTGELGPLPAYNNRIEGGVNAQLRAMLREHRGLSLLRRAKATFWWCYMHTEHPLPAAEILRTMPTDADIAELYAKLAWQPQKREGPAEWGDGLVWSELHRQDAWRTDWD